MAAWCLATPRGLQEREVSCLMRLVPWGPLLGLLVWPRSLGWPQRQGCQAQGLPCLQALSSLHSSSRGTHMLQARRCPAGIATGSHGSSPVPTLWTGLMTLREVRCLFKRRVGLTQPCSSAEAPALGCLCSAWPGVACLSLGSSAPTLGALRPAASESNEAARL